MAQSNVIRLIDAQRPPLVAWNEAAPPVKSDAPALPVDAGPIAAGEGAAAAGLSRGLTLSVILHAALVGFALEYFGSGLFPDSRVLEIPVEFVAALPEGPPPLVAAATVAEEEAAPVADADAARREDAEIVAAADVEAVAPVAPEAAAVADTITVAADAVQAEAVAPVVETMVAAADVAASAVAADDRAIVPDSAPAVAIAVAAEADDALPPVALVADVPVAVDAVMAVRADVALDAGVPAAADLDTAGDDAARVPVDDVAVAAVAADDRAVTAVDVVEETEVAADAPAAKPAKPSVQQAPAAKPQKPRAPAAAAAPRKPADIDATAAAYASTLARHIARRAGLPPAVPGFGRRAVVVFTINASGGASGAWLAQGTGNPYMDAEALAAVRRASPFPPIPPGLGASFIVRAPLTFPAK